MEPSTEWFKMSRSEFQLGHEDNGGINATVCKEDGGWVWTVSRYNGEFFCEEVETLEEGKRLAEIGYRVAFALEQAHTPKQAARTASHEDMVVGLAKTVTLAQVNALQAASNAMQATIFAMQAADMPDSRLLALRTELDDIQTKLNLFRAALAAKLAAERLKAVA